MHAQPQPHRPPADPAVFAALWTAQSLDVRTHALTAHATLQPPPPPDDLALSMRVAALPRLTRAGEDAPPELALGATIGEGGMGVVRAARQMALGREVAVKSLRPAQSSPEAVRKLLHEALITGMLEHPDIIPVYALGQTEDGAPMMVMKRVEGTAWSSLLRNPRHPLLAESGREPLAWHLDVLMRVCQAMAYAHGKGILHRDLKTDNVMIGKFGEVYVLDWGIAVALQDDHSGALPLASTVDSVAGTPSCLAPEMVSGDGSQLGVHSDIFLLGAILHQILTGKPRYEGSSVYETLFAAYACEPWEYSADLPAELVAICRKATAREPKGRHGTAQELRRELLTYLQHRASMDLLETARGLRQDLDAAVDLARSLQAQPSAEESLLDGTVAAIGRTFGESRLALREALRSWPENSAAAAELQGLLEVYAGWLLDLGDWRQAAAQLADLPMANSTLSAQVVAVRTAAEAEAAKMAALAQDNDPRIGARTRSFLALVLAVTWSVLPLVFDWLSKTQRLQPTAAGHVATTGLFAVFMAGAAVWARESLFRSRLNRSVVASGMVAVFGTLLTRSLAWYLGLSLHAAVVLDLVVFGLVLALMAANQWRRLFVPAGVFFAGAAIAATQPVWALEVVAAANLVAMSLVAFAWRPAEYDGYALVMTAAMPVPEMLERTRAHLAEVAARTPTPPVPRETPDAAPQP